MRGYKPTALLAFALPSLLMFALAGLIAAGHESRILAEGFLVAVGVALILEEIVRYRCSVKRKRNATPPA